jgi:hypothetical protein
VKPAEQLSANSSRFQIRPAAEGGEDRRSLNVPLPQLHGCEQKELD